MSNSVIVSPGIVMVVSFSCITVTVLSFCTQSGQYLASLLSKEQDDNNKSNMNNRSGDRITY